MSNFDRSSTDAMVWAKEFCKTAKECNWKIGYIDEALMTTWFANYWAAVHFPLQNKITAAEEKLGRLKPEGVSLLTENERRMLIKRQAEEVQDLTARLAAAEKALGMIVCGLPTEYLNGPDPEMAKTDLLDFEALMWAWSQRVAKAALDESKGKT